MRGRTGANALRLLGLLAVVVLAVAVGGDRPALTATAANSGVDPFDILDLQVKPFVMIVFDTSGSMKYPPVVPPGVLRYPMGGDDPSSRFWQAKRALRDVTREFNKRLNMGLFTFSPLPTAKRLNAGQNFDGDSVGRRDGTFNYVSNSRGARLFGWDPNNNGTLDDPGDTYVCGGTNVAGYFCDIRNAVADYNDPVSTTAAPTAIQSAEVYQSFGNRGYFSMPYPWKSATGGPGGTSPMAPSWKAGTDDFSIIGYKGGTNPNGWLPGAAGPTTPEAGVSSPYNNAYRVPECNPLNGECKYVLQSRVYRSNKKFLWDLNRATVSNGAKLKAIQDFDCSTVPPPVGLTDDTITGTRPCIVMADAADPTNPDRQAVYYYSTGIWENSTGGGCQDPVKLVDVPSCSPSSLAVTAASDIEAKMKIEIPMTGTDPRTMLPAAIGPANPTPTVPDLAGKDVSGIGEGIRTDGGTPIYNALNYVRLNDVFPVPPTGLPPGVTQKRYILVLTDGENRCPGNGVPTDLTDLAKAASQLYSLDPVTYPRRQAELYFVVFTSDASARNANYVAQAGSGASSPSGFNDTSASEALTCPAGATCRDAIRAYNIDDLKLALRNAFSSIANTGEYASSRGTVVDEVFEYVATSGAPYTAFDAQYRYSMTSSLLLQSNISMPNFEGRFRGYRTSSSGTAILAWEAGAKLNDRVLGTMGAVSCPGLPLATAAPCPGEYTFAQLHGGSVTGPRFTPSTAAKIRRRIFTTARNGVTPTIVPLWPPTTDSSGVAPNDTISYPPGSLDGSAADGVGLAIGGRSFSDLQTQFGACTGGDPARIPADCLSPTLQLGRAMKEAREIILAYTAGADVSKDLNAVVHRDSAGEILYKARSWVLADSTVATPALVKHPANALPLKHAPEYRLYTDGFRNVDNQLIGTGQVDAGFGLTNPDLDDPSATSDPEKKPMMTVAYLGTNHMMHAFRTGPQSCTSVSTCPAPGTEGGGEELWAYVPYDLLPKLQLRRRGQNRSDPIFMMASSMRFGDVFFPGSYTGLDGKTYAGRWRTVMFAGRGPGGKYISALDVTGVGPFTRDSLATNLPTILWNRGNPDTTDGRAGGPPNASTGPSDLGATDVSAYSRMGETWSVGALVPLDPARAYGREWVYWVGSGYTDNAAEGRTFYTLDAITGDVLYAADVGSRAGATYSNSIPANVTAYVDTRLYCGTKSDYFALSGPATAAFVGDVHGRLWKFNATDLSTPVLAYDFGVNQPIGAGVAVEAVLNGGILKPFIFGTTGSDNRVSPPPAATPPFKVFGLIDSGTSSPASVAFTKDFPERFRGTVQPLVFEVCPADGPPLRQDVFFAGTQFVPAEASTNCASTFDSVFYALNAQTGLAAYNLNASGTQEYAIWRNQKIISISGDGDKVVLDRGIQAGTTPAPPLPPAPRKPFEVPAVNVTAMRFGSPVCN